MLQGRVRRPSLAELSMLSYMPLVSCTTVHPREGHTHESRAGRRRQGECRGKGGEHPGQVCTHCEECGLHRLYPCTPVLTRRPDSSFSTCPWLAYCPVPLYHCTFVLFCTPVPLCSCTPCTHRVPGLVVLHVAVVGVVSPVADSPANHTAPVDSKACHVSGAVSLESA